MSLEAKLLSVVQSNNLIEIDGILNDPVNISTLAQSKNLPLLFEKLSKEAAQRLLSFEEIKQKIDQDNNFALYLAMRSKNLPVVEELLKIPQVINHPYILNLDALRFALKMNNRQLVNLLIMQDVLRQKITETKLTATVEELLQLAAENGHYKVLKLFLSNESIVKNITFDNNVIFLKAIKGGYFKIIDELLELPEVRNRADANHNYALKDAIKNNDLEFIEVLLEIPSVRLRAIDENLIRYCIQYAPMEVLNIFLGEEDIREAIIRSPVNPLILAAQSRDPKKIKALLEIEEVRDKANGEGNIALLTAVQAGNIKGVKALLQIPAVLNAVAERNLAVLQKGTELGPLRLFQVLIEQGDLAGKAAVENNLLLKIAIQRGRFDIAYYLLENEAVQKEIIANPDLSLLSLAIENDQSDIALSLLEFEPLKNLASENAELLLQVVTLGDETLFNKLLEIPQISRLIIDNKADILRAAAENGSVAILETLLEFPEVYQSVSANNNAVLLKAVYHNNPEVVERLLAIPEVRNQVTANHNAALRLASYYNYDEVVDLLLSIDEVKEHAEEMQRKSKPIEIHDLIITTLGAFETDQKYDSKTLAGEFDNLDVDVKSQVNRLFIAIQALIDKAAYRHKSSSKGDSDNKITRLVTNEFIFYTQSPLSLEEFTKLQERILKSAMQQPENLHLVLSSFAVKTPDNKIDADELPKIMNVVSYIECGKKPRVHFIVKSHPSEIDPVYSEMHDDERKPLLNLSVDNAPKEMYSIDLLGKSYALGFNNIFECYTAGGQAFLCGVEICLDHHFGVVKGNYDEMIDNHVYELTQGGDPPLLPVYFSHVFTSNSHQELSEFCIGTLTHADPDPDYFDNNDKLRAYFDADFNFNDKKARQYPIPMNFGPTVVMMKAHPWQLESTEELTLLHHGLSAEKLESEEELPSRKSLLYHQASSKSQQQAKEQGEQKEKAKVEKGSSKIVGKKL